MTIVTNRSLLDAERRERRRYLGVAASARADQRAMHVIEFRVRERFAASRARNAAVGLVPTVDGPAFEYGQCNARNGGELSFIVIRQRYQDAA